MFTEPPKVVKGGDTLDLSWRVRNVGNSATATALWDDRIVLSTRVAIPGAWSDPLATGEGFVDRPEQIRVERGALSGVEASVLIVPLAIPHIWAQTDQLVITVSGDLTRGELLHVAESLEART